MFRRTACLGLVLLACLAGVRWTSALEFDMVFQTKCVMEEINEGTIVVGDYSGKSKDTSATAVPLDVKVRSVADCCQQPAVRQECLHVA